MNQPQRTGREGAVARRNTWTILLVFGSLAVLRLAGAYSDLDPNELPVYIGMLAVVGVAVVLFVLWGRRDDVVLSMQSRDELSAYVSGLKGLRRWNLLWYEYALAHAHLEGDTEAGPHNIQASMVVRMRQLQAGTRTYGRIMLVLGVSAWLMVVVPFVLTSDPFGGVLWAVMCSVAAMLIWLVVWVVRVLRSRQPLRRLGRRIELAGAMETETRWFHLLEVARDHRELESRAAS